MDFNLKTYHSLLEAFQNQDYAFLSFAEFLQHPTDKAVILRHDVEKRYRNALGIARLQHAKGIRGTYYFRILNGKLQRDIIKEIAALGHEIGYHYDDLSHCKGDHEAAIQRFERHLTMLREIAPVKTICMEGAPLSKHDNRDLWKIYDYRDYGIIGEPYLDLDFSRVFYLTDTGRRWDGGTVSLRDKVERKKHSTQRPQNERNAKGAKKKSLSEPLREPSAPICENQNQSFRHTRDILTAINDDTLPYPLMITIHPQRWTNKPLPWVRELLWQNAKNVIKAYHVRRQNRRKVKNNE